MLVLKNPTLILFLLMISLRMPSQHIKKILESTSFVMILKIFLVLLKDIKMKLMSLLEDRHVKDSLLLVKWTLMMVEAK